MLYLPVDYSSAISLALKSHNGSLKQFAKIAFWIAVVSFLGSYLPRAQAACAYPAGRTFLRALVGSAHEALRRLV